MPRPTLKEVIKDLNAGKDVEEINLWSDGIGDEIGNEGAKTLALALQKK